MPHLVRTLLSNYLHTSLCASCCSQLTRCSNVHEKDSCFINSRWCLHMCAWESLSLFEQDSVVAEWEGFLEGIVSVPRPAPTDRSLGLAVDASDFPRNVPWCRLVLCWRRRVKLADEL